MENTLILNSNKNLGLLSYCPGKLAVHYPELIASSVAQLFNTINLLADYIIVDTSMTVNEIDHYAIPNADLNLCITSANVKGYIYKQSPKEYLSILETVQEYINNNCWELHQTKGSKKDKKEKIMSFIHKFIKDKSTTCTNFSELELITKLYFDINEFSVLTDALEDETVEDITQEKLVVKALRFDPDIIVVAEMRDIEAYAGQEASLTGHTVVTSLHAGSPKQAHNRVANLCRKLYPIDYQTVLLQACSAFPIVIFVHQTDDYVRRIMEVSEVIVDGTNIRYNPLYKYKVLSNEVVDGMTITRGEHLKVGIPSADLVELFSNNSMPSRTLTPTLSWHWCTAERLPCSPSPVCSSIP